MSYKEEFLNSIEPIFIFSKKPLNRFKIQSIEKENDKISKIGQINELKKLINSIQNCNLKKNSQNLILGEGNINSPIMIIGEAPGLEEEKNGKTFQGESGTLLEKMLNAITLSKEQLYSSYAVNFRPPEDRKPTAQEIKRYSVFLKEHISIIDPKIIILFGSTAMESVTSIGERISNERGKWKEII
jgi:uracil-DNA glycosylase, family 4